MGAWGPDAFDNDAACDWAHQLEESGLSLITEALAAVVEAENEYLDADRGSEALAACEVLARLRGNRGAETPDTETVDAWVRSQSTKPGPELLALAEQAIDRLLGENSELRDLWDGDAEWLAALADLKGRLRR